MDLQVPTPTFDMAVMVRNISGHKEERVAAEAVFSHPSRAVEINAESFIPKLTECHPLQLYHCLCTGICPYCQGIC
jgi:6-phosphogluconate dehydrogenase